MKYKIIAIDMDGTLLNREKIISPENIKALERAYSLGYTIIIATGRMHKEVESFLENISIEGYIISSNGAMVKHSVTNEILTHIPLTKKQAIRAINIFEAFNMYYHFYIDDRMESNPGTWVKKDIERDKITEEYLSSIDMNNKYINIIQSSEKLPEKVVCTCRDLDLIEEARVYVNQIEEAEISTSGIHSIELMKKGTSKGKALEIVANKLGIKRDEVVAIGDHLNDVSMLNYAALPLAMGNACDEAKKQAKHILPDNNESGVAWAINKIIDGELD